MSRTIKRTASGWRSELFSHGSLPVWLLPVILTLAGSVYGEVVKSPQADPRLGVKRCQEPYLARWTVISVANAHAVH
jgi:hypothetical protein